MNKIGTTDSFYRGETESIHHETFKNDLINLT